MKKFLCILCSFAMLTSVQVFASSTTPTMSVAGGKTLASVVTEDGKLKMWGINEYGEFSKPYSEYDKSLPDFTEVMDNVAQAQVGVYSSVIALKKDGTVWTWGRNDQGQIGNGETSYDSVSQPYKVMDSCILVGAGDSYMLALKNDGTLWGWGDPSNLGVSYDTPEGGRNALKPVMLKDNVKTFSCGGSFYGVVTKDGKLYMAGSNTHGELGIGEDIKADGLTEVMSNVSAVACGHYSTLILDNKGNMFATGYNDYGELFKDKNVQRVYVPQKVKTGVAKIAASDEKSAYITTDGELKMVGHNLWGELGLGNDKDNSFNEITVDKDVTDVALGWQNAMYRKSDGTVYMSGPSVVKPSLVNYSFIEKEKNIATLEKETTRSEQAVIKLQIDSTVLNKNNVESTLDVPAKLIDNRTLIPLRAIFEALDATVDWDSDTKTITSTKGGTKIKLQIGSNDLYVNDNAKTLDVPAQIIDGRTLVPVRAVAESFGAIVNWNKDTATVTIEG